MAWAAVALSQARVEVRGQSDGDTRIFDFAGLELLNHKLAKTEREAGQCGGNSIGAAFWLEPLLSLGWEP
jgi:hypothetical protein